METLPLNLVSFSVIDVVSNLPGHQHGYYRILVTSLVIKYLSFLPSKPTVSTIPDFCGKNLGMTAVPKGDWNVGHLVRDVTTGQLILKSTEIAALERVEHLWHPTRVDYLSLGEALPRDDLQCARQIYSAVYPGHFGANHVVVNTEWYPHSIFGAVQETLIYSKIEGHNIGPRFLAHITENQERVYGYILESLPARRATINDLSICKEVLAKLHNLKIIHGSLSSLSFLIVHGRALLHCFGGSFSTHEQSLFDKEMANVEDILQRGSFSTAQISEGLQAEIFAISQRDDGIHPKVLEQAAKEGKISITETQHKALLQELREELRVARSLSITL